MVSKCLISCKNQENGNIRIIHTQYRPFEIRTFKTKKMGLDVFKGVAEPQYIFSCLL